MNPINLSFVIHCHQPVGNMESIFEKNYQNAYKPFLNVLEKHPTIKATLHYSGQLLEWFIVKHPKFIQRLKALIENEQIELLSGTFYEAILSIIPDEDKIGQILKMNKFIKDIFGVEPSGMWLAEKIWEPHIADTIAKCNLQYTCLDDTQIWASSVKDDNLNGYFLTEEHGDILRIVPVDSTVRYMVPYSPVEETFQYIENYSQNNTDRFLVFADAGEKLGNWPETHRLVYDERYLDKLFTMIETSENINSTLISEYINSHEALEKVYIPASSYNEMMEWCLPSDVEEKFQEAIHKMLERGYQPKEFRQFFRGGIWRNFFIKYPESNNMHKKMLFVSDKVHKLKDPDALDLLWGGQSNLPYWHGIYGGLYLTNLRHEIYKKLIKSEYLADLNTFKTKYWLIAEKFDLDKDSHREILVNSNLLNVYISSQSGGTIFEFDYKPVAYNIVDVVARRYEPYHKQLKEGHYVLASELSSSNLRSIPELIIAKEKGLEKLLHYDNYRRTLLVDHFLEPDITVEQFKNNEFKEMGDFIETRYESSILELTDKIVVKLFRLGKAYGKNIKLQKKLTIYRNSASIDIEYKIKNIDSEAITFYFASELNYNLLGGYNDDRYYMINNMKPQKSWLSSVNEDINVDNISLIDEWDKIRIDLNFEENPKILRCPIETVSQSQQGFEKIYQASTILPIWHFSLDSLQTYTIKFTQSVSSFSAYE